jgi:hypothetical protein
MSINYTPIGPITARLTTAGREEEEATEVTVAAFGWTDAEPEQSTGVWVLGNAPGLAFLPANEIRSLEPMSEAHERTIMIAADALEKADKAREEREEAVREALVADIVAAVESRAAAQAREQLDEAMREVLVAEVVAAVESRGAAQAREQLDEAVQEMHDIGKSREQSKSRAPKGSRGGQTAPKPPNPTPTRRGVKKR